MPHSPLIRLFNCSTDLSAEEEAAIRALPMQVRSIGAKQDLAREGDHPSRCLVLLEGIACSYRETSDGTRQTMAFHFPGDMPDLQTLHLAHLDNSIGGIGAVVVGFIKHADLHRICREYPRIGAAFWRLTLIEASIFKEWIRNLGARDARTRAAHLFCEVHARLAMIGKVENQTLEWPMTQVDLGEALGLSVVHVNRVMKQLRLNGQIVLNRGQLHITDLKALREIGDFDPGYLHIRPPDQNVPGFETVH